MFKPLLAPGETPFTYSDYFRKLQYPLLCSPKFDGIRCLTKSGYCMSRSFKMLPSRHVQNLFKNYQNLDGELIAGHPTEDGVYNKTQSYVMSEDKVGDIKYYIFDYIEPSVLGKPFYERLELAEKLVKQLNDPNVTIVDHKLVENYDELIQYENGCLEQGFEGIMMRNPVATYKTGRATFRENIIFKLKRFKDSEGMILDILPQMVNNNSLEKDELGYAKRSAKKEGLIEGDIAGKIIIKFGELILDVAPGAFTHEERRILLKEKESYIGKYLKFKYFEYGVKDKPRFPAALGIRDIRDL